MTPRAFLAALGLLTVLVGAPVARADQVPAAPAGGGAEAARTAAPSETHRGPGAGARGFRCDGTDAYFFTEMDKAGTVGFGETWDARICDEGVAVYAEGATSKWAPFHRRRPVTKDEQALALVLPVTVGGGLVLIFGTAAALSLAGRLRKRVVLEAPCPSCSALLPIEAGESDTQLFCPMCGAACAITIQGRGKTAHAHASPLS